MKTLFALIVLISSFAVAVANSPAEEEEVTIVGTVLASDWDDDGNATEIAIESEGFEYDVYQNEMSKKLLDHVGKTIRATGSVSDEGNGVKVFVITDFEIETED